MNTTIIDANSYVPQKSDKLFFDCNTLMYIFYTFGNYQNADRQTYSRIFTDAIRNEAQLFVPSIFYQSFPILISEVNTRDICIITISDQITFRSKQDIRQLTIIKQPCKM